MNNTLNRTSIVTAACLFLAVPMAAQTPIASQAAPLLMASVFVPNKTSTEAAKPLPVVHTETMKAEPIAVALPSGSLPKAIAANALTTAMRPAWTQIAHVQEPPTSRRFGFVKVAPGALPYAVVAGSQYSEHDRFGIPGVTRLTFGGKR